MPVNLTTLEAQKLEKRIEALEQTIAGLLSAITARLVSLEAAQPPTSRST